MKHIDISHIEARARAGAFLPDCIKESAELAVKNWKTVILIHNGNRHKIDPQRLLNAVEIVKNDHI